MAKEKVNTPQPLFDEPLFESPQTLQIPPTPPTPPTPPLPSPIDKVANNSVQKDTEHKTPLNIFREQLDLCQVKALPSLLEKHGISVPYFVQMVIGEVAKNDKLLQAFMENPKSMFASILAGAEIGLIPSSLSGEFFLIPRNLKQPNGNYKNTVTPLIGYKGLVRILLRSGDILRINSEVVYEGDKFKVEYGTNPVIFHEPLYDAPRLAKNIKYAYAAAKLKNGETQFEVMTRAQIEAVKNMSKVENHLYFSDTMGINRWMERKTALMQLSKMLPKDIYSQKAISIDSMVQSGSILTHDKNFKIEMVEGGTQQKLGKGRDLYASFNELLKDDREMPPNT
jgi:recombination protein RecT